MDSLKIRKSGYKSLAVVVILLTAMLTLASAQDLREMQLAEVSTAEQKQVVVLDPSESILVVSTNIPDLNFVSNLGIRSVENPGAGLHYLHLDPGTHLISFQAQGFRTLQERVYIDRKQSKQVRVEAAQQALPGGTGAVKIITEPAGANIELDGFQIVEQTPYESSRLTTGYHRLKLTPDDEYVPVDTTFLVRKDDQTTVEIRFTRKTGSLAFDVNPPEAEVYLDGKLLKPTPKVLENYPTGSHVVEARIEGKTFFREEVKVRHGQVKRVDIIKGESETALTDISFKPVKPQPAARKEPKIRIGLKVGFTSANLYQHSGGSDSHGGPCAGLAASFILSKHFSTNLEVLYNNKGGELITGNGGVSQIVYMTYLETPVMVRMNASRNLPVCPFFNLGISIGYLLDAGGEGSTNIHAQMDETMELGGISGGGLDLRVGRGILSCEVRYVLQVGRHTWETNWNSSFPPFINNHSTDDALNIAWTLLLGYAF